jgi:glycosyltransferase involved in cell wall biosynthesis
MKLSVALCTYNGERFLPEQLASIREQSRLPDELVISDDASSDRSREIAQEFAKRAPFPVRVQANAANVGSTLNFAQAIAACTGEVIALADQDDIWFPHKLAILESTLAANPEAGFVFSDAEMVDEWLNPLGHSLWDVIRFSPTEQKHFQEGNAFAGLLRRYRVTGATLVFRARFRELVLPIPPQWIHDAWIALMISSVASCALVQAPLIRYRQHSRQQLGEQKRGLYRQYLSARKMNRETFEAAAERYLIARERMNQIPGLKAEWLALIDKKMAHYHQRIMMRHANNWRVPFILSELWRGNYHRFSLGWKAIAQDLLLR